MSTRRILLGVIWASCIATVLFSPQPSKAVTIGQVDTFEDGTALGWFVPAPSPNPPGNESTGGPAGAGDAFLMLTANGQPSAGGRLSVLNETQWSGNYLAAGVGLIQMNLYNFGPSDLYLRLLFEDLPPASGSPPINLALSAQAVFVPANSGWMTAYFPITPADLIMETYGTVTGALSETDTLRIFHNPDPFFPGPGVGIPPVNAALGVDNITAVVPVPATMFLLGSGLAGLLVLRKKFSKSY
jgi:PEP-CTERM motif